MPLTEVEGPLREALAGRYRIDREIGRGGMAVVYLAHDLRHDREVALKVLLPEVAAPPGPERFRREIQLAARLQHPHILTVFDSGEAETVHEGHRERRLWYTMPFVDGESLRQRLHREGPLPLADALRITRETARALECAHQQGVIHRDIKPENILLTRDGTTLVTDFGIARALNSADSLTRTGTTVGTPAYMSPERTGDAEIDGRSDLYSLAAVLYEMLSGVPAWSGPTLHAIVAMQLADPAPSITTTRPGIPLAVDHAIRRALAPEPVERYATVTEFVHALEARGPRFRLPSRRVLLGGLAVLVGVSALLVWWSRGNAGAGSPGAGGIPVVAVLPFENLGDTADAYFADGVTDEVRTKLAQVTGLEVIARGSSVEYRHTTRRPDQIARELGADYLLTGTVRWDKSVGAGRVRVTPELVDQRAGQAGHTRWAQQFDASLTDVFQVQADIATRVVDALGLALADSTRKGLTVGPTSSLAAYDEFLKGEEAAGDMKADQANLRLAIRHYARAVSLDSNFVLGWTQLSRARTSLYSNGVPDPELRDAARAAMERARHLRPSSPSVYLAAGDFYSGVNPVDNTRAAAEYERGLELAPDNVDLLGATALTVVSLGDWTGAATRLARAVVLDPRSANTWRRLAVVHDFLRQYPAADSAADRALALAPGNPTIVSMKVMIAIGRGDLDSARAVIRTAARVIPPEVIYPFMANYQDLYWVLEDDATRLVLASSPAAFDDDPAAWGLALAGMYQLRGDSLRMQAYADSARFALLQQIRVAPEDGQRRVLLGLSLAFMGEKDEAIREGRRGVLLRPIQNDLLFGPYVQLQLVRIYLLAGEPDKALDQLEPLLKLPFYLSPGWLRVDPGFAPLRGNPRFERLLAS